MFLLKLYQQHKGWFFFVLLFILIQLINNIRQDIAISPFYQYGMYSQKIVEQKSYEVYEVEVNGNVLQTQNFSPQEWDKIILPLQMNASQKQWNSNVYSSTIKRLLHTNDSTIYVNRNYSEDEFNDWYKDYLQNIINKKIDSVSVKTKTVSF